MISEAQERGSEITQPLFFLQSLQEQPGGFGKDLVLFPGQGWFGIDGRFQRASAKLGAGSIDEVVKGNRITKAFLDH